MTRWAVAWALLASLSSCDGERLERVTVHHKHAPRTADRGDAQVRDAAGDVDTSVGRDSRSDTAADTATVTDTVTDSASDTSIAAETDTADASPCPADMVHVDGAFCMDRYEAPNVAGALPLVMFHYYNARDWCAARDKRLCFDDEWLSACEGAQGWAYPYGPTHDPGICNDDKVWRTYNQSQLSLWPSSASASDVTGLDDLLARARAAGAGGATSADHVAALYQGEGSGTSTGCVGAAGVFDLTGNVEEWTRRRDGGSGPDFSGALKGRYWAETRTCQSRITSHGNAFRFYEIGFRCCRDPSAEH